jgi:nitrogenase subunit NifH
MVDPDEPGRFNQAVMVMFQMITLMHDRRSVQQSAHHRNLIAQHAPSQETVGHFRKHNSSMKERLYNMILKIQMVKLSRTDAHLRDMWTMSSVQCGIHGKE